MPLPTRVGQRRQAPTHLRQPQRHRRPLHPSALPLNDGWFHQLKLSESILKDWSGDYKVVLKQGNWIYDGPPQVTSAIRNEYDLCSPGAYQGSTEKGGDKDPVGPPNPTSWSTATLPPNPGNGPGGDGSGGGGSGPDGPKPSPAPWPWSQTPSQLPADLKYLSMVNVYLTQHVSPDKGEDDLVARFHC